MFSILRIFFQRFHFLLVLFLLAELFAPLAHAAGTGLFTAIAAKTGKQLCTARLSGQPSLLALSLDATILYVAGQGDTVVHALNPTTCAIQRTFETHEPVYGLAVAASTAANATPSTPNQLWISGTTSLTIFDANGHLLGTTPVAGGPQNISIPGGFTAYVTTRQGTVVAVDLNKRQVIQTLLSRGQFGTMDYDAVTGEIYVPDQQNDQLDVLAPHHSGHNDSRTSAHFSSQRLPTIGRNHQRWTIRLCGTLKRSGAYARHSSTKHHCQHCRRGNSPFHHHRPLSTCK
jgi:hypothetical protein